MNDIGVDVNFILEHSHAADMLSFVCGLGPRKTAALIKVGHMLLYIPHFGRVTMIVQNYLVKDSTSAW